MAYKSLEESFAEIFGSDAPRQYKSLEESFAEIFGDNSITIDNLYGDLLNQPNTVQQPVSSMSPFAPDFAGAYFGQDAIQPRALPATQPAVEQQPQALNIWEPRRDRVVPNTQQPPALSTPQEPVNVKQDADPLRTLRNKAVQLAVTTGIPEETAIRTAQRLYKEGNYEHLKNLVNNLESVGWRPMTGYEHVQGYPRWLRTIGSMGGGSLHGLGRMVGGLGYLADILEAKPLRDALYGGMDYMQDWGNTYQQAMQGEGEPLFEQAVASGLGSSLPSMLTSLLMIPGGGDATPLKGLTRLLNPVAMGYRAISDSAGEAADVQNELLKRGALEEAARTSAGLTFGGNLPLNFLQERLTGPFSGMAENVSGFAGRLLRALISGTGESLQEPSQDMINAAASNLDKNLNELTIGQFLENLTGEAAKWKEYAMDSGLPSFFSSALITGLLPGASGVNQQANQQTEPERLPPEGLTNDAILSEIVSNQEGMTEEEMRQHLSRAAEQSIAYEQVELENWANAQLTSNSVLSRLVSNQEGATEAEINRRSEIQQALIAKDYNKLKELRGGEWQRNYDVATRDINRSRPRLTQAQIPPENQETQPLIPAQQIPGAPLPAMPIERAATIQEQIDNATEQAETATTAPAAEEPPLRTQEQQVQEFKPRDKTALRKWAEEELSKYHEPAEFNDDGSPVNPLSEADLIRYQEIQDAITRKDYRKLDELRRLTPVREEVRQQESVVPQVAEPAKRTPASTILKATTQVIPPEAPAAEEPPLRTQEQTATEEVNNDIPTVANEPATVGTPYYNEASKRAESTIKGANLNITTSKLLSSKGTEGDKARSIYNEAKKEGLRLGMTEQQAQVVALEVVKKMVSGQTTQSTPTQQPAPTIVKSAPAEEPAQQPAQQTTQPPQQTKQPEAATTRPIVRRYKIDKGMGATGYIYIGPDGKVLVRNTFGDSTVEKAIKGSGYELKYVDTMYDESAPPVIEPIQQPPQLSAEKLINRLNGYYPEILSQDDIDRINQHWDTAPQEIKSRLQHRLEYAVRNSQSDKYYGRFKEAYEDFMRYAEGNQRVSQPAEEASAQPERGASATQQQTPKNQVYGRVSRVRTTSGMEVETRFKLIEADDLIASHNTNAAANPDYPVELQPRQRDRMSSAQQIENILSNIDPSLLGDSRMASEGAPIVGADGVVESGNGRTIALKAMHERGNATSKERAKYIQYIHDNTEMFGINPLDVQKFRNPILVRERITDIDRVRFTQDANESNIAAMSSSETGMKDAARLDSSILSLFDADKDILANREFINAFIHQVVPQNERGTFMDKDGKISQDGVRRIQNALFAKAYGDAAALGRMSEATDVNIRNVNRAMLQAAPRVAILEDGIQKGTVRPEYSIREDISSAANKLAQLREDDIRVSEYLIQQNLFDDDLSPVAKDILQFMDTNKQKGNVISKFLTEYAELARQQGSPNQTALFDTTAAAKADVVEQAMNKASNTDSEQRTLFQGAYQGSPTKGIEKMSTDYIGTGEGAQVYGWGLYAAQPRETAEWYRKRLAEKDVYVNGTKYINENHRWMSDDDHSISHVSPEPKAVALDYFYSRRDKTEAIEKLERDKNRDIEKNREIYEKAIAFLKNNSIEYTGGQLYRLEIPDSDVLLDWDKTLSEQPEHIQKIAAQLLKEYGLGGNMDSTGKSLYKQLEFQGRMENAENPSKWASLKLNSLGIPGLQYLDGMSRNKGEGSHNFVIWDDNAIEIMETYYQAQRNEDGSNRADDVHEELRAKFRAGRVTAEEFVAARDLSNRPQYLTQYTPQELQEKNARLYLTEDNVGFALKPDGDMINVFNNSERKGAGQEAVTLAIVEGATKTDCIGKGLARIYNRYGFTLKKRVKWNDKYAPDGWDYDADGRPPIYEFEYPEGLSRNPDDVRARIEFARGEQAAGRVQFFNWRNVDYTERIRRGVRGKVHQEIQESDSRRDRVREQLLNNAEPQSRTEQGGSAHPDISIFDRSRTDGNQQQTAPESDIEPSTVQEDVKQKLVALGVKKEYAEAEGALLEAGLTSFANRMGMPVKEFYDSLNLQFTVEKLPGGNRGAITFGENGTKIAFDFNKSDVTTGLHEPGHLFLELFKKQAEMFPDDAALQADWMEIRNFLGWKDGQEYITGKQHEKFADEVINFAETGEVRNGKLKNFFERFKQWLVRFYEIFSKNESIPISDEMRGVFERLLAQDAAFDATYGMENSLKMTGNQTYNQSAAKQQKPQLEPVKSNNPNIEIFQKTRDTSNNKRVADIVNSPNVVAERHSRFAPFYNMGVKAVETQERFRASWNREIDKIYGKPGLFGRKGGLLSTDAQRTRFNEILITGDALGKVYSKKELTQLGADENMIKAYNRTRRLYDYFHEKHNEQREKYGKEDMNYRTGYVPHFFHAWRVMRDGEILSSYNTLAEATKDAEAILKENPNDKLKVMPALDDFGGRGQLDAITLGDMQYFKLTQHIKNTLELSLDEAKELLNDAVKMKNRSRVFKNAWERKGFSGFDTDMEYAMRHYANLTARYLAMDTLKHKGINLFERSFGRFDNDHEGLARYTKDYLNDVLGVPTAIEKFFNNMLKGGNLEKCLPNLIGDRPATIFANFLARSTTHLKLGFLNVSSALMNLTQLHYVQSMIGATWTIRGLNEYLHPSTATLRLYNEAGITENITLENPSGYSKVHNVRGALRNVSMSLFRAADGMSRKVALIGAYRKALSEGYNRAGAIEYAKKVNRDTNFDYSVADTPDFIRHTGPAGTVLFQFKKFPIKLMELALPGVGKLKGVQQVRFWTPFILASGIFGLPGSELLKEIIKGLFGGKDIELELKKAIGESGLPDGVKKTLLYGLLSNVGIDVSRRVGMGDFIPSRPSDLMGPGLSTLSRVIGSLPSIFDDGRFIDFAEVLSPGLSNPLKAFMGEVNDKRRDRVKFRYETFGEKAARFTGARPAREAVESDAVRISNYNQQRRSNEETSAIDAYLRVIDEPNTPAYDKAVKRLSELNISKHRVIQEARKQQMGTQYERELHQNRRKSDIYEGLINYRDMTK